MADIKNYLYGFVKGKTRRDFLQHIYQGAAGAALMSLGINTSGCGNTNKKAISGKYANTKALRPNIIYIMLDELGYYELSCMGNKYLETLNIDKMVREGMRFTQMLAGGPVCAPTRSTFMQGLHTGHCTVRGNSGGNSICLKDITIAQILKKANYATGGFGKWGLGDRGSPGVPEKHGFDIFYGYYHQVHAHCYFPRYLVRNGKKVILEGNTDNLYQGKQYSEYLIFNETVKFIKENKDRPFFCYCPWTVPHGLWGIPENEPSWQRYKDKPWTAGQRKPTDARVYAAMVNMADRQIGEILALLKKLKLDKNTIVFVSGDNGGQRYFRNKEHPYGFFGPNLNPKTGICFRGEKGSLYEGGLRIPFIAYWPGHIQANTVTDYLGYFPDIMPTLAELAGVKAPNNIDGISIIPTLLGTKTAQRPQKQHKYLYWEFGKKVAVRIGKWKGIRLHPTVPFELYDLSKDITEKHNVASEHPQIVALMEQYALQAHKPPCKPKWLDKSKVYIKPG